MEEPEEKTEHKNQKEIIENLPAWQRVVLQMLEQTKKENRKV